jgi:GxxExxY protein
MVEEDFMSTNREDAKSAKMRELGEKVEQLAYEVIGAAIEVHRVLGPGFLESVYQEALRVELQLRRIAFISQAVVAVNYKGAKVGEGKLDFLVGNQLVIELKAVENLAPIHTAQVLSYLKMTDHQLGLLINFNVSILKDGIRRIILS